MLLSLIQVTVDDYEEYHKYFLELAEKLEQEGKDDEVKRAYVAAHVLHANFKEMQNDHAAGVMTTDYYRKGHFSE